MYSCFCLRVCKQEHRCPGMLGTESSLLKREVCALNCWAIIPPIRHCMAITDSTWESNVKTALHIGLQGDGSVGRSPGVQVRGSDFTSPGLGWRLRAVNSMHLSFQCSHREKGSRGEAPKLEGSDSHGSCFRKSPQGAIIIKAKATNSTTHPLEEDWVLHPA